MDREYAVDMVWKRGREEIGLGADFFTAAREAKSYAKLGATQIILKHYEDGDLVHQWDLVAGRWQKYE